MEIAWLIFLLAIGACVGSFLNVVIYRLPRGESIVFPPSHCPSCGRAIRWYDNIPLVSWFVLRARCRWCKAKISPRYIIVEAATAVIFGGLYAWYFLLDMRAGAGSFQQAWPMYLAHAALLSGLLACSLVDIERWIVPLEICWVVSVVGLVSAGAAPQPFIYKVSPTSAAMALAAAVGLTAAMILRHFGLIRRSFADADEKVSLGPAGQDKGQGLIDKSGKAGRGGKRIVAVAITKAHGVDPRKEVLLEAIFLAPGIILAVGAYYLLGHWPAAWRAWERIASPEAGLIGSHFNSFLSALFGFLVGGAIAWVTRILGTLAFGKEAMGMGDIDIMAMTGAVTGWVVPTITFFVAPFLGLIWAMILLVRGNQRELPYGPWLAGAAVIVMLFYDQIAALLQPYAQMLSFIFS